MAHTLAKPGVDRRTSRNVARDIISAAREFGLMCTAAEPYMVELPDGKGSLPVFLPHEVYPPMLAKGSYPAWCLGQDSMDAEAGLGPLLARWAAHGDVNFGGDLLNVGILGMHCDGVAYTSSLRAGSCRKILVSSWNVSSSSAEAGRNQRQPYFVIRKARLCGCGCGGYHTLQALFEVFAWSLRQLLAGRSPGCRHDSSPWSWPFHLQLCCRCEATGSG